MSTIHSIESMLKELNGHPNSVAISSGIDLLSNFEMELDKTDTCVWSDETFTSAGMPSGGYVEEKSKYTRI